MLLHEVFSEMPQKLLADLVIARRFSLLRNAQVYFLIKESMKDMHDLVPIKDFLPQRYYVLHNSIYYARDMLLAYVLSEYKLNPVINIPELQRFRNLDIKEMMTQRWSRSPWYHTKVVGDALSNMLKRTIEMDFSKDLSEDYFYELYTLSTEILSLVGDDGDAGLVRLGHSRREKKHPRLAGRDREVRAGGDLRAGLTGRGSLSERHIITEPP